jgi:hypothetical protein
MIFKASFTCFLQVKTISGAPSIHNRLSCYNLFLLQHDFVHCPAQLVTLMLFTEASTLYGN